MGPLSVRSGAYFTVTLDFASVSCMFQTLDFALDLAGGGARVYAHH